MDQFELAEAFDWNGSIVSILTIKALSGDRSIDVWEVAGYGQSNKPDGDVVLDLYESVLHLRNSGGAFDSVKPVSEARPGYIGARL